MFLGFYSRAGSEEKASEWLSALRTQSRGVGCWGSLAGRCWDGVHVSASPRDRQLLFAAYHSRAQQPLWWARLPRDGIRAVCLPGLVP